MNLIIGSREQKLYRGPRSWAKEAAEEKARAEAAERARREIERKSKEQKEVKEIKGREEEIKLGRKEPKENEADADIDTVRAKEEAKVRYRQI